MPELIPPSRIDEVERNFQWGELMTPEATREPLIELIRSVNELNARLEKLEGLASQPQWRIDSA